MPQRLLGHAKHMRHAPTAAEALLWRHLRAHRFAGFKFKRQQPLGPYIVDFVCFVRRLVIEVDGSQHLEAIGYDMARAGWLNAQGFRVLRFWNDEVLVRTELVLEAIWTTLHEA
ncbi:endonuclease domain-containing protein [Lysobacter cavernae]|uniref:Endonuclease domain-containing protein n=1 Tax=Lysobacter cavernae TaxID=1685901 RepID=A0ABV7RTI0_9GAMM